MKTALNVKLIFESDKYRNYWENGELPEITLIRIMKIINEGKITVEMIDDGLTVNNQPVIIIKEKNEK